MPTHRKPARFSPLLALAALAWGAACASDKPRTAPPTPPAQQYSLHETHPAEHVTVAAEPCIDAAQCKFFRLAYVAHGFLPVRVVVTNDRDEPVQLDDVRIQFLPADGGKEGAATDEDLNRRLFSGKQAVDSRIPILGIPIHHEPVDAKITHDGDDFGFKSTTVAPHSTLAGYVFYDTRSIDDPVLKHAELYVKMMRYSDAKGTAHELFAFSLPFDTWLAAQPKPEQKKPDETAKPVLDKP